jgi:alpha-beta hydrolase superfamily lysophospholipase
MRLGRPIPKVRRQIRCNSRQPGYWAAGKAYYDPAKITVPTLLVQAEWDRDLPPYMAQTLFPLLVNSPSKRYVMLAEGTHTIIMEKNRLQLFEAVQAFLDEAGRS